MYRRLIRNVVATLFAIGGISLGLATPNFAQAQQCAARCPKRAQTERIVGDLIRETILDELGSNGSHKPSVSVRMKVLSVNPFGEVTEPLRGFLSPVEVGHQEDGDPALGIEGDVSLSYIVECEYEYLVTITTRERDFDHHHKRGHHHNHSRSVTESIITVRTPIASNIRCGW